MDDTPEAAQIRSWPGSHGGSSRRVAPASVRRVQSLVHGGAGQACGDANTKKSTSAKHRPSPRQNDALAPAVRSASPNRGSASSGGARHLRRSTPASLLAGRRSRYTLAMKQLTKALRLFAKLRFSLLGLATIKDIPTEQFWKLAGRLPTYGWKKTSEYSGPDAWIDYGRITFRRRFTRIKLEWDNATEGSVEGPRRVIREIARANGLAVTYDWQ